MLELKNISYEAKTSKSRRRILDHISLCFNKNSFTVITGKNGSGKSTLAEITMGIKTPTAGQIIYKGQDITAQGVTERANHGIAYAFQQPTRLKGITVYELLNISSGELISPEYATKHLEKVGLSSDYLTREINDKLSGGELKRIEIASILARPAELMIFDEPEAGIDLWSFDSLTEVFKKLKPTHTIIVISHQERILKLADKIIVLENGKVKSWGTPVKILPTITGASHGN